MDPKIVEAARQAFNGKARTQVTSMGFPYLDNLDEAIVAALDAALSAGLEVVTPPSGERGASKDMAGWCDPVADPPPCDENLLLEVTVNDERGREWFRFVVVARWVTQHAYWFTSLNTVLELDPFRSITGWRTCPAERAVDSLSKLPAIRAPSPDREAAIRREALEEAAQIAYDQTCDHPAQTGDWNDACEHVASTIRALIATPDLNQGDVK